MRNRPHRSAVQHNAHRSHVDVHVIAYLHRTAPWSAGAALEWTEAWPKGRLGVADAACYAQAVNRQNVGARAEARPPHHPRVGRHSSQAFRAAAERPASHHRVIAMPLFSPSAHARSVCYRKRPRHSARVGTGVCCSLCVPRGSNKKHRGGAGSKPTRDHVGAWNRHTVHTKFTQTNLILTTKPTHRRTCTGTTGVTDSRRDTAVLADAVAAGPVPIFNLTLLPRGGILTFPDTLTTQGLSLWSLNTVGGGILTFPDTLTTQGLSLWSLNTHCTGTGIKNAV